MSQADQLLRPTDNGTSMRNDTRHIYNPTRKPILDTRAPALAHAETHRHGLPTPAGTVRCRCPQPHACPPPVGARADGQRQLHCTLPRVTLLWVKLACPSRGLACVPVPW